jgi:hypothetical protein
LAIQILEASKKKVFVLSGVPSRPKWPIVSYDSMLKLKNCAVLADDLINVPQKEYEQLQTLLNFNSRHYSVDPVVLACHSVVKNNVFGLVNHVSHVYFTLARTNVRSLGIVLDCFKFSRAQRDAHVATFLTATTDEFGYYVLDTGSMEFYRGDSVKVESGNVVGGGGGGGSGGAGEPKPLSAYKRTADIYLPLFCAEPQRAQAIFNWIIERIPLTSVRASDLTILLKRKGTGGEARFSLIDYLHCLNSTSKPSGDMQSLHAYLSRYVVLPRCCINNRYLMPAYQAG